MVAATGAREVTLARADVRRWLGDGFFWLDIRRPTPEDLELLDEELDLHELAIEDSLHFGQRPKLEAYDGFTFLVLYGYAPDEDGLVEVHCYYSERFLLTVRRDEAPALDGVHRVLATRPPSDPSFLLYRIADGLVDSFFPVLSDFGDRLELIEDALIGAEKPEHLHDVVAMKRRLARLRSVVSPQRDLFGALAAGAEVLPGAALGSERYFRNVYDHLIRLSEMVDTSRDLMTATVDVYLSASSQRLNSVMKQLAAIATIFLPLTFVTGFFGQNFPWMVDHVGGWAAFVGLGVGMQVAALAALLVYFARRGWF